MEPFDIFRQLSKNVNFSFLFGASYKRFSSGVLETSWTPERVRAFVKDKNLEDKLPDMRIKHESVHEDFIYYYVASEFIRTNFFKTYPGLEARIKRNEALAKEHGYIRSYHGGVRRVPLLMWCTDPTNIDERTNKPRVRKDEDFKEMAGLINITANTSIQNDEVCDMNMAITRWVEDDDCFATAPIFGMVHDSSDFYIKRNRFDEMLKKIQEVFELRDEEWQDTLSFLIEGAVVDFTKEGDYYKNGKVVIE